MAARRLGEALKVKHYPSFVPFSPHFGPLWIRQQQVLLHISNAGKKKRINSSMREIWKQMFLEPNCAFFFFQNKIDIKDNAQELQKYAQLKVTLKMYIRRLCTLELINIVMEFNLTANTDIGVRQGVSMDSLKYR
jgi:hypothetical protein